MSFVIRSEGDKFVNVEQTNTTGECSQHFVQSDTVPAAHTSTLFASLTPVPSLKMMSLPRRSAPLVPNGLFAKRSVHLVGTQVFFMSGTFSPRSFVAAVPFALVTAIAVSPLRAVPGRGDGAVCIEPEPCQVPSLPSGGIVGEEVQPPEPSLQRTSM